MAATKNMVIFVKRDGVENLKLVVPQTKNNIAKLVASFGEFRTLKVRNAFGASGNPATKEARDAAKAAAKRKGSRKATA